jgi:plastocyanin
MRRIALLAAAAAALLLLAGGAFAGNRASGTHWTITAGDQSHVKNAKHGLQIVTYLPQQISIDAGDTVTWRVPTGEPHTITFLASGQRKPIFNPADPRVTQRQGGSVYAGAGYFNSGVMPAAAVGGPKNAPTTYTLTFTKAGDYRYYCLLHGEMTGIVHVLPAGTPVPFTASDYRAQSAARATELIERGTLLERVAQQVAASNGALVIAGTGDLQLEDQEYLPNRLTIHRGQTVTFLNLDPEAPHTVTFGTEPKQPGATVKPYGNPHAYAGGPLNSGYFGVMPPWAGPKWVVRFVKPGTYRFYCVLHDDNGMKGVITVK